jgi:acid phosphatase family membrane protein YuiD
VSNSPIDLFRNPTLWAAFLGWMAAQTVKMALNLRRTRRIDFAYLVSLGGMPSAHSAMVSALALSTGLNAGFGSQAFTVSLALAIVVMFDASTVRRASGLQARLLNQILDELFKEHHLSQSKLKELLGHTRTEVFAGMLLGLAVALIVNAIASAF